MFAYSDSSQLLTVYCVLRRTVATASVHPVCYHKSVLSTRATTCTSDHMSAFSSPSLSSANTSNPAMAGLKSLASDPSESVSSSSPSASPSELDPLASFSSSDKYFLLPATGGSPSPLSTSQIPCVFDRVGVTPGGQKAHRTLFSATVLRTVKGQWTSRAWSKASCLLTGIAGSIDVRSPDSCHHPALFERIRRHYINCGPLRCVV